MLLYKSERASVAQASFSPNLQLLKRENRERREQREERTEGTPTQTSLPSLNDY
jgi:hypothetical protein